MIKSDLIPPLPDVVVQVLELLNSGDTEPADLEGHLQLDPVLVAKMLCMVNSPFYGLQREISSIKDAVMVLGFGGVRSLLLASGTTKHLQGDYRCYGHDRFGLWKHSLATAGCAKTLATTVETDIDTEELFVAGLLHDIGKMLIAPYLLDRGVRVTPGDDPADVEKQAVGIDHSEAAGLVAAKWNLGLRIQDVLSNLRNRDQANNPRSIAIVRVANAVAEEIGVGYEPEFASSMGPAADDLTFLQLDDSTWDELRRSMDETVHETLSQLESLCS